MSYLFSADEVFAMAIQMETNGAAFYRKAAARFPEGNARDMFAGLAGMEDEHRKTFETMRDEAVRPEEEPADWDDIAGEARRYLQSFMKGQVFDLSADPSATLAQETPVQSILIKALTCERDSILFYMGMRKLTPRALGRDKIDRIIDEEMEHVAALTQKLSEFAGK